MKYFKLALKNTMRQKRRTFLIAGAIGFCFLIIIIINSLSSGIVNNFLWTYSHLLGDLYLYSLEKTDDDKVSSVFREDTQFINSIKNEFKDIDYLTKRTKTWGNIIFGNKSVAQSLMGVDFNKEKKLMQLFSLNEGTLDNHTDERSIIVSEDIAKQLRCDIDDTLLVKVKTIEGQNNVAEFRLIAIMSKDMGEVAQFAAFTHQKYLSQVLDLKPSEYTELNIYFKNSGNSEQKAKKLHKMLSKDFSVMSRPENINDRSVIRDNIKKENWEGSLYSIYSLEENNRINFVNFIANFLNMFGMVIIGILFLISILGIMNTLRITINERRREIGTMRAFGMQKTSVQVLFLWESIIIAIFGIIVGFISSLIIITGLSIIEFNFESSSFFNIFLQQNHLCFTLDGEKIALNSLFILLITLIASYFPTRKASSIDPIKAINSIT